MNNRSIKVQNTINYICTLLEDSYINFKAQLRVSTEACEKAHESDTECRQYCSCYKSSIIVQKFLQAGLV